MRISKPNRIVGFTLIELLTVIAVIGILAAILIVGLDKVRYSALKTKSISNMRQLGTAVNLYAQDHNGKIPLGDGSADGEGNGGRGMIWINYIAEYVSRPELDPNADQPALDEWDAITSTYVDDVFVCANLNADELAKVKAKTVDPIGGIGYNVRPLAKQGSSGYANANWGGLAVDFTLIQITEPTKRLMMGSSYDWHLEDTASRAYDRFGPDKAAAVFWDGHAAIIDRSTYDLSISAPETL